MRASYVMIVLAACGKTHELGDAGMNDAQRIDGGAGGTAHVRVHVTSWTGDGVEVAGARVEAASAGGAITGSVTTGADGRAELDAPSGGMIVVTGAANDKTVIAAVKDGDAIEIGAPVPPPELGTASIDFPLDGATQRYELATGCTFYDLGLPGYEVTLYELCAGPRTIVVKADHGLQPPTYLIAPNITLTDGDDIALTGTYAAAAPATIGVTGFPANGNANSIDVFRSELAAGLPISDEAARPALSGGAGSVVLSAPVGAGDRQLIQADFLIDRDTVFAYAETALGDATVPLDTLPELTITGTGTWTLGPGAADGIFGTAMYHDSDGTSGALRYVAPPDATAIPVPDGVTITAGGTGWIFETSTIDGYDAYRAVAAHANGIPVTPPFGLGFRGAMRFFYS
jgi:hypothetical protein